MKKPDSDIMSDALNAAEEVMENKELPTIDIPLDEPEQILPIEKPASQTPTIKDSGARTEFVTGAVRDIQEGKGRCDLMPLDVLHCVYDLLGESYSKVLYYLEEFKQTGDPDYLYNAIADWVGSDSDRTLTSSLLLQVAVHFENGANKYGENNWQKGIPCSSYINSAVRHYIKCAADITDEPHDIAMLWNIMCCAWTAVHKPELNDYALQQEESND